MRKIHNRLLALTLAAAMVLGMMPAQGIHAAEETAKEENVLQYERIDISTAEEFADFASKCYLDSWSEDKYVSLRADIDLTGTQLRMVPVFNGIFDGVGHTISGFDYLGDGYVVGLFRYVESDGVIQNLTLKGNIASENQKECIGSICGVNYGTIKNCTFQGTVSGRDTVGGIAGMNGRTGVITGCTARGRITGYYSTGGIAGINHGTLNYCSNRAGINDDSAWVEEDDEMGTGMGIIESLTTNDDNELYSGVDTGGIAGFSDGAITRCTNSGTVGYEHTGYNIGGIAGRQSGVVSLCTNNGTVYGRKDIGGIVGQMEPFIEIHEAESIRKAVDKLHDLIDKTINDMQATKDGMKQDFDTLTLYSDSAVDAADVLAEQIGDFVDDNLDQMQAITDRLDHVMAMTPEVFNDFEAAENSFINAIAALKDISGDLGKITDISDEPYDVSKSKRITLLHTVGGYITSSSYNPKAGEAVTITAKPDDTNSDDAYQVTRIDVVKVTNGESVAASTSTSFNFTMPAENVRVEAYFEPKDGVAVRSNVIIIDKIEDEPETETETEIETDDETETETETDSETETETDSETESETDTDDESGTESSTEADDTEQSSATESSGTTESDAEDDSTGNDEEGGTTEPADTSENTDGDRISDEQLETMMRYGAGAAFLSGTLEEEEGAGDNDGEEGGNNSGDADDSEEDNDGEGNNGSSDIDDGDSGRGEDDAKDTDGEGSGAKENEGSDATEEKKHDSANASAQKRNPTVRAANATVKITSNLSGSASCIPNADNSRVTITAEPSGGYAVDYVTVDGSKISSVSGNSYAFAIESDKEYKVHIQFRKITTKSGAVENAKSEIENAIREAQDAAGKIRDELDNDAINITELQKMLSATTTVMENTEILADIYGEQVADSLKAVNRDLSNTSDHLKSALDSVKAATRHTRDIVDYVNAQPAINFAKLGAEYDYNRTNLHNQLRGISDSLKILSDNASSHSDVVNADLKAVNDQINVIFNLLADRLSDVQKLGLEEFYEDVSDEDIDSITTGRTESCSNKGIIKGDINVGGIAGSMSIDDEDPEDSAAGAIEYELGRRFITKCLVTDSVNEGYITAKKNGAGGICGYMNHGIIVDSESYGSVESTEGDYVGGICGESLTIIKRCYALCSVAGNRNVGGIAGYADTLKNCYSMAEVQSENGRAGAIAGQVTGYDIADTDADDTSEESSGPKVIGNYYVGENVHGIDNISYIGVAEPIAYDELLKVEQLPVQFQHLKVIYRIGDTYLGSEEVEYGARLDKLNYPQIPQKEGCYGVWPDVSDQKMGGIFVVEGEYKDNVTVVQSGGEADAADESRWSRPYALIEDIFTEDTVLNARVSDRTPPEEAAGKQNVVYEVTLENSGIRETDSFALRILNPYEDATVYGYTDGAWTALETRSRGQYLQVSMTGTHAYFCVAENTSNLVFIIVCAAAAAVAVILLIVLIRKGSARRKQRLRKKAEEEKEKQE